MIYIRRELRRLISHRLDLLQDLQRESSLVYGDQQMSVEQRHSRCCWWARSQIHAQVSAVGERLDWLTQVTVDLARLNPLTRDHINLANGLYERW